MSTKPKQFQDWNLKSDVLELILSDQEFVEYLLNEKDKYPFPTNYIPKVIEFRFNNSTYLKLVDNLEVYSRDIEENFSFKIKEIRFDNECALLLTKEKELINRMGLSSDIDLNEFTF